MEVDKESYRGGVVKLIYDEGGGWDPRGDSQLARLVFQPHPRYDMPNEIDFPFNNDGMDDDPEDGGKRDDETPWAWFVRTLKEKYDAIYIVSVYMIDHSGVAYRAGRDFSDCDPGQWDSGMCGVAIVTTESAEEIGTSPEDFAKVVEGEIDEYSSWANGEVYAWVAKHSGQTIESCGGYIGYDCWDDMKSEARAAIDWFLDERDEKANDLAADAIADLLKIAG